MAVLTRYWVTFDGNPGYGLGMGVGVTAWNVEDALQLVTDALSTYGPLPPIAKVIEDVDVSTLDARHVIPNMDPPIWRGVWFPRLGPLT